MNIEENILREEYNFRGGGCELDLTAYGYEDELLSAYQHYLGGGMRGSIGNSCTVADWRRDEKLVALAEELREYYTQQLYERGLVDEYNDDVTDRPISYPGL